ncbi:MAG: sulfatase-like hydrolase/transferase [Opitutales bacterium]|nr:sulfatase-like hydrolase/transferase [Opitutales bacterium]
MNSAPTGPNILFITADQHRGDTLGCSGHPCIQTPHMDQLAYEGVNFTSAYVDCPLCIPARTALITGRHGHNFGCADWMPEFRVGHDRNLFLASLLTRGGYQTELIGKTHWFLDPDDRAGFEHITPYDQLHRQRMQELNRPAPFVDGLGFNELHPTLCTEPRHLHLTDWVVDRSLEFLETRQRSQPFFLWASLHNPHPPLTAYEPYYSMYDNAPIPDPVIPAWLDSDRCPAWLHDHRWMFNPGPMSPAQIRKARSVYYGMITYIDHQIQRIFGRLKRNGLWDNTLIVYTSDHGEQLGDYHDAHKCSFYEGSARIPLIIRFPRAWGLPPGRTSEALVDLVDLYPTLLEAAGLPLPAGIDGVSLMPLIRDAAPDVREFLHGQQGEHHMIRTKTRKYLYYGEDGAEQVFDMTGDRRDDTDLSDDPAEVEPLRERLISHLTSEGNPACADGQLVNAGRPKTDRATLRGTNPLGWH